MQNDLYIGIDFSGNHLMWRPGCASSNIWIAEVARSSEGLNLRALRRVQELPGDEPPFVRLVRYLARGNYRAAAIDAPFSIPGDFLKGRSQAALLAEVADLARSDPERPFPEAKAFVRRIAGQEPCQPKKPWRRTEEEWKRRVNVRSSLWAGARGGAAMTAACLTLLHAARRPIWPHADIREHGLLVEGFPTAQLQRWRMEHDRYNGAARRARRVALISQLQLARRLVLTEEHRELMETHADALDAVVCTFGAIAVVSGELASSPAADSVEEGWIAVHR
jgi:hypothetical protein